jgi:outer membrane protein OmpA-like peptidoglycan-associated protein
LDDLADILKMHRKTQIRVDAHTDCTKSEEENLALSESRAAALKEALVARGVDAARITARGWGESKPAASNATEAGRQVNRRVTVTLIGSQS